MSRGLLADRRIVALGRRARRRVRPRPRRHRRHPPRPPPSTLRPPRPAPPHDHDRRHLRRRPRPGRRPPSGTADQNGSLGSCPVFPADNAWNRDVSTLPVARQLAATTSTPSSPAAANKKLHADFGGDGEYGIPYITVPGQPGAVSRSTSSTTATRAIPARTRSRSARPSKAAATGTSSPSTATTASSTSCSAPRRGATTGTASSGAVFDLRSNALRPEGWTSADAAGLPIFPGLVRYDEVASGHINHALRFTVSQTQTRLHPPGDALGVVEHRPEPPADGPAAAAQGELRPVGLHRSERASCSTR